MTQPAVSPSAHGKLLVILLIISVILLSRFLFFFVHKGQQHYQDHKSTYNLPWFHFLMLGLPVAHVLYRVAHSGYYDYPVWNAVRDFITFFTKYKTYLFCIIILSLYIIILSCKEIKLSFEEIRLSFKEIRLSV